MEISGSLVIAPDTVVLPVAGLSIEVRRQINADESDFAVTRPNSRTTTRIIDSDAAKLLQEFHQPSTIVQAVIRYCRANQKSPEETLDAAFPMLQRLVQERLLLPSDSPDAQTIQPMLAIGAIFAGVEILECVQNLEDTDVYLVRTPDSDVAALKLMRSTAGPAVAARFEREASVLKHLNGVTTPSLLESDTRDDSRYLLLSWCEGSDCASLATRLREAGNLDGLLKLCIAIVKAYARLHDQGVIHSDVHTSNVLVDDNYAVRLIDFGLARIADIEEPTHLIQRGGVAYFMEPEYFRSGHRPPASSMHGEQYSLAAMLYFLFSGKHYLDFVVERQEMERQIVEDAPLPFTAQGVTPWQSVEDVLGKALSKQPAERFDSIEAFLKALSAVEAPVSQSATGRPAQSVAGEILARVLTRLELPLDTSTSPQASLSYGSAGIACALHRIACAHRNPSLLALADVWCERAVRDFPRQDTQYTPAIEVTAEPVGSISPYHMEAGGHFIRAVIAHSRGDAATQQQAVDDFAANSTAPCDHLDLTLGRSGTLLATAHLLAAIGTSELVDIASLRKLGESTLAAIWTELDGFAPMVECPQIRFTGIAHGWAGILYATLCWSRASGTEPPSNTVERLNQLAELAHHAGRRASWNPRVGAAHDADNPFNVSWCNGTAGQVHLWLAAYSILKDEQYLLLAEQSGRHTAETGNGLASLCCGLTGQAYALLALYRQTGEGWWLQRAQQLVDRAATTYHHLPRELETDAHAERLYSLYKGEIGLAVLAADLEHPANSAFPAFELIEYQPS
jgi:serine/threonine protein kinase